MTRRVLMLAYFYPPNTSGGVPRTVSFVKYLARLEWRTTVIAPRWQVDEPSDASSDSTRSAPAGADHVHAGKGGDDSAIWQFAHQLPLFWRIEGRARDAFQYPDRFAVWARDALPAARETLERKRHCVLYSTSPPVTSHWIALRLKREFGLPWVADLRDPWTDNVIDYGDPPSWRRRLDLRLERTVYREADCIIANTEANRSTLITKHGIAKEKVVTITNGFDEEDFVGIAGTPPKDRFRITYCGSFYRTYNPRAFLVALKALIERRPDAAIQVTLAGLACQWAAENIRDPALLQRIDPRGQISNREVLALLAASHLLLITYPAGIPYAVPGKLYEYIRSGRPIVAVCDRPSEVASLLEATHRGRVFRPDETAQLADFLEAEYDNWHRRATGPAGTDDSFPLRSYERKTLTQRLANVFETISKPEGSL